MFFTTEKHTVGKKNFFGQGEFDAAVSGDDDTFLHKHIVYTTTKKYYWGQKLRIQLKKTVLID